MTTQRYSEGIRRAYEGELVGERLYRLLSVRCADRQQQAKLAAISKVEHRTHSALKPIAARLGIEPSEADIQARVSRRADTMQALSWSDFIQKAAVDWPPYVVEFEALRQLAPADDAAALAILVRHEEALVEFAQLEMNGNATKTSLRLLEAFLAEAADPDRPSPAPSV